MPFTIDSITVVFQMTEFERLAAEEKVTWTLSSLKNLRSVLAKKPAPNGATVIAEIKKIPLAKRQKYKKVIKYLVFSWPGLIDTGSINIQVDGKIPNRLDFQDMFASMDTTTDFVDMMYGISSARGLQPYKLGAGRVRFADDFNNMSNLGTGAAFNRSWQGYGDLSASPTSVTASFKKGATVQDKGIRPDTRMAYVNSMLNSRYSPTKSLGDTTKTVEKDTQKSLQSMVGIHGKKDSELHYWMHARFVKSVRRACKGGIAMVASHPSYRQVDAKVHFLLDGLGDLGKMARKDRLPADKGGYLAITSSELDFCCRYWDDSDFPLSNIVKFYLDGKRVYPPWEADYTVDDAKGDKVYSNQEAWLRYRLGRELLGAYKPFPRMNMDHDDNVMA